MHSINPQIFLKMEDRCSAFEKQNVRWLRQASNNEGIVIVFSIIQGKCRRS